MIEGAAMLAFSDLQIFVASQVDPGFGHKSNAFEIRTAGPAKKSVCAVANFPVDIQTNTVYTSPGSLTTKTRSSEIRCAAARCAAAQGILRRRSQPATDPRTNSLRQGIAEGILEKILA
jgi:hypothetical protein